MSDVATDRAAYEMKFDPGTIRHLGVKMYSTLPPVIGEFVANAWDANATKVEIEIPETRIDQQRSKIVISDNGIGMSDADVRGKYLIIGRNRRKNEPDETPAPLKRKIMGRKGIGKFSAFGIAKEIDVESMKNGEVSRFQMNYDELMADEEQREITFPALPATGNVTEGTKITLSGITIYRTRPIAIDSIRQKLARRFAVIGEEDEFEVIINGIPISPEDRNLKLLLEKDMNGELYLWEYENEKILPDADWTVTGWIGALDRTTPQIDGIDRGIVLMARGKLVQEPFAFDAGVGQQYAFSYLIGELHVDFVDEEEDTIATTRNTLVWATDANAALMEWGQTEVNKIARQWGRKRNKDNTRKLEENELYCRFREQAAEIGNQRALKLADKLIRQTIEQNPDIDIAELESLTQMCIDFLEFNAFWDIAEELTATEIQETSKIIDLLREWEIVEAKEMARVTNGRIATIKTLQDLIASNAMEVPTLHDFLKEFPWVLDPRWTMVDDEVRYSDLLRNKYPEHDDTPEEERRIDFLCVREGTNLVVVEIKRPQSRVSRKELTQIEDYVIFMEDYIQQTTDPDYRLESVTGYLLCGSLVNTAYVRKRRQHLERSQIYIRRYGDLLGMVQQLHADFLERYNQLREVKQNAANRSDS